VDALCRELQQSLQRLPADSTIATIYLGGGTPSTLSPAQLHQLFQAISAHYTVSSEAEITLEANPDDLTPDYIQQLRQLPINRLSIGVQSFRDEQLRFIRRRHTAAQAIAAVRQCQEAGFSNISIDLIFGFPRQTPTQWAADLQQATDLGVQHLSAYSLMYEEGTPLTRMLQQGTINETDEETSLAMYDQLLDHTQTHGYERYEISNFARPGYTSRHNSSYWQSVPYLGIGAGAHAFDGTDRWANPGNLSAYIRGMQAGQDIRIIEHLTPEEQYEDYVMTRLRTSQGVSLPQLSTQFGPERQQQFLHTAHPHLERGHLAYDATRTYIYITRSGLYVSDSVMSDFMLV